MICFRRHALRLVPQVLSAMKSAGLPSSTNLTLHTTTSPSARAPHNAYCTSLPSKNITGGICDQLAALVRRCSALRLPRAASPTSAVRKPHGHHASARSASQSSARTTTPHCSQLSAPTAHLHRHHGRHNTAKRYERLYHANIILQCPPRPLKSSNRPCKEAHHPTNPSNRRRTSLRRCQRRN